MYWSESSVLSFSFNSYFFNVFAGPSTKLFKTLTSIKCVSIHVLNLSVKFYVVKIFCCQHGRKFINLTSDICLEKYCSCLDQLRSVFRREVAILKNVTTLC